MINQYKDNDLKIYNNVGVLEYYSLNGISEWAFLAYSALTFVFFFFVAYLVSPHPLQLVLELMKCHQACCPCRP